MRSKVPWLRIHLSTALVLLLLASVFLYLNLDNPRLLKTRIASVEERQLPHGLERTIHIDAIFKLRGWPLYASPDCKTSVIVKDAETVRPFLFDENGNLIEPVDVKAAVLNEFPPTQFNTGPLYGFWNWNVVLANLGVILGTLLLVAFLLEYRLRRQQQSA